MKNSSIESLVTAVVAAFIASGCVTSAQAESQAGLEAGSMSSTQVNSQAASENNSQSTTENTSHSTNEQTSQSGTQNTSQAGAEAVGGPLTNMGAQRVTNAPTPATTNSKSAQANNSSMQNNPLNNGDAGNSVGNVVNGVPTSKTVVTNSKKPSKQSENRQISDVSGAKPAASQTQNTGLKKLYAPHPVTRAYRWFTR